MNPRKTTSGGFAYIWQSKWVGIIAIKTKRTQIHYLSDFLVAVASLDLKVPTANLCGEEHCVTTQRTVVEQPSARRRAGVLLGVRLAKMSRATAHYCDWTATVVESRFKLWGGSSRKKKKQKRLTGSQFSACSFIKMLFFCQDMLYRLFKQYDHVIISCQRTNLHTLLALTWSTYVQIAVN